MSSKASATIASGWLDLATFGDLDTRLYESKEPNGVVESIHSKDINPISHYARLPVPLKKSGQVGAAQYLFAKTADFAGNTWVEFTTPDITVKDAHLLTHRIAFCQNLGHNVFKGLQFAANDIPIVKLDSVTMDFFSEANLGAGQYEGYMRMIGNTTKALTFSSHLPPIKVKKPLHELFFCQKNRSAPQDALPLCAAKFNTLSLNAEFVETLEEVIRVQVNTAASGQPAVWVDANPRDVNLSTIVDVVGSQGLAMPLPDVWCEYALVHDEERKAIQSAPIDLVIKQVQSYTGPKVGPGSSRQTFHFSQPTRALFFGARNTTASDKRNFSNYTTSPEDEALGIDPIRQVTLWYDNSSRLQNASGDYFTDLEFLYHAARVPFKKGIHLLAYCEDTASSEIDGSTNFSKLSTDLEVNISETSTDSDDSPTTTSLYALEIRSESLNLIRFEENSLSFPSF